MNWLKKFSIIGTTAMASFAIAQSASARFTVFVSGNDPAILQRVRTVSPAAFITKINRQPVVQAGTFNSEPSADLLVRSLNNSGIQAQKYFQASGGKESNVQVAFTDTPTTSALPNPQQVFIQQNPNIQTVGLQTDTQQQVFTSVPQQTGNFPSREVQPVSNEVIAAQQLPQQTVNTNFRYITAVPAKLTNQYVLSQVRQYVPNAFFTNSGRGTYIHAGAYQNRDLAESVSTYLRSQGIDSRVLYF
jgi:hypothetical protein